MENYEGALPREGNATLFSRSRKHWKPLNRALNRALIERGKRGRAFWMDARNRLCLALDDAVEQGLCPDLDTLVREAADAAQLR